jgi:chromosome segregation ATPase|tara:strand:- start:223 stop:447 length:225 start_codon:yes stop_codon:yes gene_type:complete
MSYSPRFNHYEHKMIDIQCDIEKLRADLEYHEQKIRMITNELDEKNEKLSTYVERLAWLRRTRDARDRRVDQND